MSTLYSNAELWDLVRAAYPNFANHTSKGTADLFTEAGFDRLRALDPTILTDYFELSMRVWLNLVNISHAKDPLAEADFGEYFDQPWGGIVQRIATNSIKPISPAYKNLKDGDSVDMQIVRKPTVSERFWRQNFDYQSLITMPAEFQYKQIFVSEYGMSEFQAGIMEGLQNGYTLQVYTNKLEALNAALNGTILPLQDTQKVNVSFSDTPTDEELKQFILSVMNILDVMEYAPQTGDFNAAGYESTQDASRLRLLVRPGYKNALKVSTLVGAFNPGELSLNVPIITVPNFGGLVPYADAEYTQRLYPVYDTLGSEIGFSTEENATEATHGKGTENPVYWKDPNADVMGVLADKGVIFECRQNPYTVQPAPYNVRGLYQNFFANSPNNTVAYDANYNLITFTTAQ